MRNRTAWSSFIWRLRTGAFGFYVEGGRRLLAAGSSARPARRVRLGAGAKLGAALLLVVLPVALAISDGSRSIRLAGELVDARPAEEVASLRGALQRYYRDREEGRVEGREIAVAISVSAYTSRECETDDTPFVTAANTPTRPGVLALSRDLLKRYTPGAPFDFGDIVHIRGLGDFVVEDSMHSRWERRADIWFESVDEAREFGRRVAVMTGPYGLGGGQRLERSISVASAETGASQ